MKKIRAKQVGRHYAIQRKGFLFWHTEYKQSEVPYRKLYLTEDAALEDRKQYCLCKSQILAIKNDKGYCIECKKYIY